MALVCQTAELRNASVQAYDMPRFVGRNGEVQVHLLASLPMDWRPRQLSSGGTAGRASPVCCWLLASDVSLPRLPRKPGSFQLIAVSSGSFPAQYRKSSGISPGRSADDISKESRGEPDHSIPRPQLDTLLRQLTCCPAAVVPSEKRMCAAAPSSAAED